MEDKIIRYKDFKKAIKIMLEEIETILNTEYGSNEMQFRTTDSWIKELITKIPVFATTKELKCMVCDKFQSKVNYCKLYEKEVGLFDSCKED